jgi:hypothetical protein
MGCGCKLRRKVDLFTTELMLATEVVYGVGGRVVDILCAPCHDSMSRACDTLL